MRLLVTLHPRCPRWQTLPRHTLNSGKKETGTCWFPILPVEMFYKNFSGWKTWFTFPVKCRGEPSTWRLEFFHIVFVTPPPHYFCTGKLFPFPPTHYFCNWDLYLRPPPPPPPTTTTSSPIMISRSQGLTYEQFIKTQSQAMSAGS